MNIHLPHSHVAGIAIALCLVVLYLFVLTRGVW